MTISLCEVQPILKKHEVFLEERNQFVIGENITVLLVQLDQIVLIIYTYQDII